MKHIQPQPTSSHTFFDRVQVWLQTPLNPTSIIKLRKLCGRLPEPDNRPAGFDPKYRQRLQLCQPSRQAFEWLARRSDAYINQVELALDLTFSSSRELHAAFGFAHAHLVRRWRSQKQQICLVRTDKNGNAELVSDIDLAQTVYDGPRWAPNLMVFYKEPFSRISGELHCLHIEQRVSGKRPVRSIDIHAPADLLEFNHRQFWDDHLLLFVIDYEKLGRLIDNRTNRRKRRTCLTTIYRMGSRGSRLVNLDHRLGLVWLNGADHCDTMQQLVLQHRKKRIQSCLVPVSSAWLRRPPTTAHYLNSDDELHTRDQSLEPA